MELFPFIGGLGVLEAVLEAVCGGERCILELEVIVVLQPPSKLVSLLLELLFLGEDEPPLRL